MFLVERDTAPVSTPDDLASSLTLVIGAVLSLFAGCR